MPTKTEPQVYACHEAFAGHDPDGTIFAVAWGEELEASHPLRRRFPDRFTPAGQVLKRPDDLRQATPYEAKAYAEHVARHQPTPISNSDVLTCVQEFTLTDASAEDAKRLRLTQIVVPAGARVHRWSPIAQLPQFSDRFQAAT